MFIPKSLLGLFERYALTSTHLLHATPNRG